MVDFRFFWSTLLRRLPVMVGLLMVCGILGVVTAFSKAPTYSTAARLLIGEPALLDGARDSSASSGEQLQIIEQQLMTRANLIDIANKLRVFADEKQLSPDEVVGRMRAATTIRRSSGRDKATLLVVGFSHPKARVAADVVNEYVTKILSENSRDRMDRAEGALTFYQQEVERLSVDLDAQSSKIVQFKSVNANALPENLRYRQDRQALLLERQARLERDKADVTRQRDEIKRQFEETGQVQEPSDRTMTAEEAELQQLQAELRQLLSIYNESSPRVRALRNRIAAAEELAKSAIARTPVDNVEAPSGASALLNLTLSEMDSRIESVDAEMAQIADELNQLEVSINATAANAIALAALERDQNNIQTRYNAAVANLNQARSTERLEASARGQRITVIENASVPNAPSGPNRLKIATAGIGLGVGLAGGFYLLMEFLNRNIRRPVELTSRFKITPIAVIPYIEGRPAVWRRRTMRLGLVAAVMILLPIGLWFIHTQYMPLDRLTQKVLTKIGI